jgi:hypothetical protein
VAQSFTGSLNLPPGRFPAADHGLQVTQDLEVVPALGRCEFVGGEDAGQVVLTQVVADEDAKDFIVKLLLFEGEEGAVRVVVAHQGLDGLPGDKIRRVIFEEALIGVELPQRLL